MFFRDLKWTEMINREFFERTVDLLEVEKVGDNDLKIFSDLEQNFLILFRIRGDLDDLEGPVHDQLVELTRRNTSVQNLEHRLDSYDRDAPVCLRRVTRARLQGRQQVKRIVIE